MSVMLDMEANLGFVGVPYDSGERIEASLRPRYDLPDERVEQLTHKFLDEGSLPEGRYFCAEVAGNHELANVARGIERKVFEESFANNDGVMQELYAPYEDASSFFMVFDREERKAISTLRVIGNSPAGHMTLNETLKYTGKDLDEIIERHQLDPATLDATWDVGTLAVLPEYRGKRSDLMASTLLYRAYFLAGRTHGIQKLVAIIDPRARKNAALLGIPLSNICDTESFDYEGSKGSAAVIGDFPDFEASVSRQAQVLQEKARVHIGDLLHGRVRRIIYRKIAARTAGRLASGEGLDSNILLLG